MDQSERERVPTNAIRDLMRRFERAQRRRPESIAEFSNWLEERGD